MNKKLSVYELVLTSIIGAVILILAFVPNVGFIQVLPGVAVTIIHIPVIIGAFILGWRENLFLGAIFGLSSLLVAATRPTSAFDLAFINPLVSVLPRMLFGVSAHFIARGFKKINDLKFGKLIIFGLITVISGLGIYFGINHLTKETSYKDVNANNNAIFYTQSNITLLENKDEVLIISEAKTTRGANKKLMAKFNVPKASIDYFKDLNINEKSELEVENLITLNNNDLVELQNNSEQLASEAATKFKNNKKISIPVAVTLIVVVAVVYYIFTVRKDSKYTYIASVFILSAIVHTILVISAIAIINPSAFVETFNIPDIMLIILSIAAFNGVIEAFVAALIGTPIATALLVRKEGEIRWFYFLMLEIQVLK